MSLTRTIQQLACFSVLLGLILPATAADSTARDQLPLGHPDFYPSPERPIG